MDILRIAALGTAENETQKKQRHAPSGFFTENHEPFPAERAAPAY